MHKVEESSSEHQLLTKKYRQRRQTQGKMASASDLAFAKSMRDSDKENESIELNSSNLQITFGKKIGLVHPDSNIFQFSAARVISSLNLIDQTQIDCFMVKSQAERSIECLGTFCLLDNRMSEEVQLVQTFRDQIISKINSCIDDIISQMKVASEKHINVLSELVDFTSKNLDGLTVGKIDFSH
jgi:hypothetical protein